MIALMVLTMKYTRFYFLKVLLALGLMLGKAESFAIEVEGLYQATIIVESRNNEQEQRRAFSEAMREVLIKVSGLTSTINPASIRRALNNPEPFVESFKTQATIQPLNPEEVVSELREVIAIEVNFYESEIQRLLDENNIPIWPINRPETLVWLIVEGELEERQILGGDNLRAGAIAGTLKGFADERGLPLLFPLLDLEDQLRLDVNALWELDEMAIMNASRRYQAESILALRIYRSLSGEIFARSLYFFRDNVFSYEEFELSEEDFIRGSVNLATNELSQYYSVLISGTESSVKVNMQVDGINSTEDYSQLLKYLSALNGVKSFQLTRVQNSSLSLELDTGGQLRQLVETIALESFLQEVAELRRTDEAVSMHYRWVQN